MEVTETKRMGNCLGDWNTAGGHTYQNNNPRTFAASFPAPAERAVTNFALQI